MKVSTRLQIVLLAVCCGCEANGGGSGTIPPSCLDAATGPLIAPRDAGPACVTPGGARCPVPDAGVDSSDRASWLCYTDRDCSVFPEFSHCDSNRCAGVERDVTCAASTSNVGGLPNPAVSHTYSGANGSFSDHCDTNANLIDYQCETMPAPCGPGPNGCEGPDVNTGRVVPLPQIVDCAGRCRAAHCDGRCPMQGDPITFEGLSANGREIRNDADGRTYTCSVDVLVDQGSTFDCAKVPARQTGFVEALGLSGVYCTGAASFGSVAVVLDGVSTAHGGYTCGLSCSIDPTSNCGS